MCMLLCQGSEQMTIHTHNQKPRTQHNYCRRTLWFTFLAHPEISP